MAEIAYRSVHKFWRHKYIQLLMDFEGIICFAHYNHPFLRNIALYSVVLKKLEQIAASDAL